MSDDRFLSVAEVADRVGLKHQAVRRAISRGELPAIKLCGRVRIEPGALAAWVAAGRMKSIGGGVARRRGPIASNGLRRLLDNDEERA